MQYKSTNKWMRNNQLPSQWHLRRIYLQMYKVYKTQVNWTYQFDKQQQHSRNKETANKFFLIPKARGSNKAILN